LFTCSFIFANRYAMVSDMMLKDETSNQIKAEHWLFKAVLILLILPLFLPFLYYAGFFVWQDIRWELSFVKMSIFQIIVEWAGVAYLMLAWRVKKYRPSFTIFHFWLIIIGLILVIASLVSLDPGASFFSSTRRGDGILWLFHVGLYIFILSWLIRDKLYWEFIFQLAIMGGVFVLLLSPVILFLKPESQMSIDYWYRHLGTVLGNPNFLAHYFLLLLLLTGYFVLTKPRLWNWAVICLFLGSLFVLKSDSALFLGIFLVAVFILVRQRRLFCGLFFGGLLSGLVYSIIKPGWLILWLAQFSNVLGTRWQVWRSAVETVINNHPWLGFGWGNSEIMWNYAGRDFAVGRYSSVYEAVFDKMHNVTVEFFVASGIIGLLSLLILIGLIGWTIVAKWLVRRDPVWLFFGLAFGLHFLFLLFNFDTLMSYILISILLAAFVFWANPERLVLPLAPWRSAVVAVGGSGLLLFTMYWYTYLPLSAYILVERAHNRLDFYSSRFSSRPSQVFILLEEAMLIRQPRDLLLKDVVQTFNLVANRLRLKPLERRYIYHNLQHLYLQLIALHPSNPYYYYTLSSVERNYGHRELIGQRYLEEALKLAPHKNLFKFELALLHLRQSELKEARKLLLDLQESNFFAGKIDFYLALVDFKEGAVRVGRQGIIKSWGNYRPTPADWQELAQVYQKLYGAPALLSYCQELARDPRADVNLFSVLINTARRGGRDDLAEKYMQIARKRWPNESTRLFLATVKSTLKPATGTSGE